MFAMPGFPVSPSFAAGVVDVQGGDLEHGAGALAVGAGNQGRMDVDEVPFLEKLVDGVGDHAPHAEHGLEGVGPGTQVGHGAQVLQGVPLGLNGEVGGTSTTMAPMRIWKRQRPFRSPWSSLL